MFSKFLCKFPVDLEWAHSCVYRFIVVLNQGIRANLSNCTSKKADKAASRTIDMVRLWKWSNQSDTTESWVETGVKRELLCSVKVQKTMNCFGFSFLFLFFFFCSHSYTAKGTHIVQWFGTFLFFIFDNKWIYGTLTAIYHKSI